MKREIIDHQPSVPNNQFGTLRPNIGYKDIPGYFDFDDIYDKAVSVSHDGSHFVEIGVLFGRSTAYMISHIAKSGKQIAFDALDPLAPTDNCKAILENINSLKGQFPEDMDKWIRKQALDGKTIRSITSSLIESTGLASLVNLMFVKGQLQCPRYKDASLDFVFIDAEHSYEDTAELLQSYWPKIQPGGILAGHDYPCPTVQKAVKDLFGNNFQLSRSSFIIQKSQ